MAKPKQLDLPFDTKVYVPYAEIEAAYDRDGARFSVADYLAKRGRNWRRDTRGRRYIGER